MNPDTKKKILAILMTKPDWWKDSEGRALRFPEGREERQIFFARERRARRQAARKEARGER